MKKVMKAVAALMLMTMAVSTVGCKSSNVSSKRNNSHKYVDLGLPSGTLWATCNVGADTPEDYGDYFAWGETGTKNTYNWDSYKFAKGTSLDDLRLTKYCNEAKYGNNGFTDNLTVLQTGDDPAASKWGSGWRMPTKEQWEELKANTTSKWTTRNGVNGMLFTASNGNSLFLPAAGYRWDCEFRYAGSGGGYRSSSLVTDSPNYAWNLNFEPGIVYVGGYYDRYYGLSVRPVRVN